MKDRNRALYEETTGTLLCGDLLSQLGPCPALTRSDVVGSALEAERLFRQSSLGPNTQATFRKLAELAPRTLAIMHGSSFEGDGRRAWLDLARGYAELM